jgi:pimeloyl-ACP methyl ester carboxylesterase
MRRAPTLSRRAIAVASATLFALASTLGSPDSASGSANPRTPALASHPLDLARHGLPDAVGGRRTFETHPASTAKRAATRVMAARSYGTLALSPCDDDPDFLCGTVPVRLDRGNSHDLRTIGIHVEVFSHRIADPSAGVIVIGSGGPGVAISGGSKYGYLDALLGQLPDTFDIVFVDQRGLGQSQTIDCPELQQAQAVPKYLAANACHDQLGDAANLYSTRAVADDIDDVRKALGVAKINIVGNSYAGNDAVTYAVRHRQHLRSVVAASAELTVGEDTFWPSIPRAFPRVTAKLCARSASCRRGVADPAASLAWLAARLRHHPLVGTWTDGDGVAHTVRLTETLLANWILPNPQAEFAGPGEIAQAAEALRHGDPSALVRLAGENDVASFDLSSGDPIFYSAGHNLARRCVDEPFPWNKAASRSVRLAQFGRAWAAEPAKYGPISKTAWAIPVIDGVPPLFTQPDPCISSRWKDIPAYPAGSKVPGVPTLVLAGEYDTVVPTVEARRVTKVLTNSRFVEIAAAFHNVWFYPGCTSDLVVRFISTLSAGDTRCAATPPVVSWLPGAFTRTSAGLPAAHPTAGTNAPVGLRRAATSAVWSLLDTIRHSFVSPTGVQPGLRGGTLTWTFPDEVDVAVLDSVKFTNDVSVSGAVSWPASDNVLDGDLAIRVGGAAPITLHLHGAWLTPGADRLSLTGVVNGHPVSLTVSAT